MGALIIVLVVLMIVIGLVGYVVHEAIESLHEAIESIRRELRFFQPEKSELKEPIESLTKAIYLLMGALPKDKK